MLTGGAHELDLVDEVCRSAGAQCPSLAGKLTLEELAAVLESSDVLLSNNTGPVHIAAAVGTPTVSLFPPTIRAVRFRPWMVPHVLLGDQDIACRGCRARACPLEDQPCLGVVTVDDVLRALDGLRAPLEAAP